MSMGFKILVVDDERPVLEMLKSMLESQGCEVVAANDGRVAARLVERRKFDGVILDASMPHLDGFQLTQVVRNSPSNRGVPVIMITGTGDVQTMRKGFQAGITLFLSKPISNERLAHTLNALRGAFLKEKRRYARLIYRDEVICQLAGRDAPPSKLSGLDLSEGGMALMRAAGLGVGLGLTVQFKLPGAAEFLKLFAKIVRQMPPDGIAVSFVDVSPGELRLIQKYISGAVKP